MQCIFSLTASVVQSISSFLSLYFPNGRGSNHKHSNCVAPGPNYSSRIIRLSMTIKFWFICSFGYNRASLMNGLCTDCCVASNACSCLLHNSLCKQATTSINHYLALLESSGPTICQCVCGHCLPAESIWLSVVLQMFSTCVCCSL